MTIERQKEPSEQLKIVAQNSIFEIYPTDKTLIFSDLTPGSLVSIASSPSRGIERTLETASKIKEAGFEPIPHLAARWVKNYKHLAEISAFLEYGDIHNVFLIAGDNKNPIGNYDSSVRFLHDLLNMNEKIKTVGIAGYPEGSPYISSEKLASSLVDKVRIASNFGVELNIHTQVCYDSDKICNYAKELKSLGISNKIYLGVPIPSSIPKQLAFAASCGVGDSITVLKKIGLDFVGKSVNYDAKNLLISLSQSPVFSQIAGLHIFTMNNLNAAASWQKSFIEAV